VQSIHSPKADRSIGQSMVKSRSLARYLPLSRQKVSLRAVSEEMAGKSKSVAGASLIPSRRRA